MNLPPLTDAQRAKVAFAKAEFTQCKFRVERDRKGTGIVCLSIISETHISKVWYRPDGSVLVSGSQKRLFDISPTVETRTHFELND